MVVETRRLAGERLSQNNSGVHRMKTISTKYLGPTSVQGSRVKATQAASLGSRRTSVTLPYDYRHSTGENHCLAAAALIDKLGWPRDEWHSGGTNTGMVFVLAGGEPLQWLAGRGWRIGNRLWRPNNIL
jgi:hypothetical protein|tara:strand:- start:408 stop:794 length:387 start_codon:yes stop_codon:yes gene_type:complete